MSSVSDKKQLESVIDGFLRGRSAQYRIIHSKVIQYVHHQRFGADVDRDEIVSEVMEIIYNNLRAQKFKGDSITALSVYIYTIVRFRISRVIRRRQRLTYDDEQLAREVDPHPDHSIAMENKDLIERIYRELDEKCADLLRLKFLEQWSDQEIADKIKKSKNATSTALSRCLGKVQNMEFIKKMT